MKILIIDDSVVMRNIHKNILRKQESLVDDNFIEARDGDFAWVKAMQEDIDLFLVDWNMPGLNGLEFTKKIRATQKYEKTPIIMITSEAAKYNVMEAIEAGVTNYIVKPVDEKILWEKISKYIK